MTLPWTTWLPRRRYFVAAEVEAADLIPDHLPRKAAIVVRSQGRPKWVAFDCPCQQRHRLLVNLDARRRPHWRLGDTRRLDLAPSINVANGGRRCHFWVRAGSIRWAPPADDRWRDSYAR